MKQNFTMPFTESGITLNFPDSNYFCFENCFGFQTLSAFHFKEMDACWFDTENRILYVIELKDFTNADIEDKDKDIAKKRVWNLVKKSVDSLCMFLAILNNTQFSTKISSCLPPNIKLQDFSIKFIHIINCLDKQEGVQFLRDDFIQKIKPYQMLFDFKFSILTYQQAKKHLHEIIK